MEYKDIALKASEYIADNKLEIVEKAYLFALKAHEGQVRKSGEPYIKHPLSVTMILTELQMDASTLAAALLHDVSEDSGITIKELEKEFGAEVSNLVQGVTKLDKLHLKVPGEDSTRSTAAVKQQAENLRKMLVAMSEDLRVVFIKLADRLHNMRTLGALSPEKQKRVAFETQEIYAPLAHRLGIWELKWQLEDLSFRYLEPRQYKYIAKLVASRRAKREQIISEVVDRLKNEFEAAQIVSEVSGRPKHIYSIYKKIDKYAAQGKHFDDIYDLLAIRVVVDTVPQCYNAMGIIHSLWHPLPRGFDDYIANPRPNGYQSLHTIVMYKGVTPLEVQIRTHEMHHIAEYGVAAHWRYKEGGKDDLRFEERIGWLRQLIDWHRELSGAEEFLESVKTDIFIDQVFVFTPKGEVKDLPKGSTPLDFAYRIHTELGHRCIGGKVNGKLVPLSYRLKNGDVVEVVTTKKDKGPSRDWLNPHLNYVKTHHAREKIRQWFKRQQREENIERGRELLEKEYKQFGLKLGDREALAKQFKYDTVEDFLAAIGYGGITAHQVALKQAAQQEQPRVIEEEIQEVISKPKSPTSSIKVMGVGSMLTNVAKCCNPVPGDPIIGYVTRNSGVTIHREDCYNVSREQDQDRLIRVEWGQKDAAHPVPVVVIAWNRVGLVRDISTLVAEEKVNIVNMNVTENDDNTVTINFILETKGLQQLGRIMAKIEGVKGVLSAHRSGDRPAAKN